MPILNTSIRTLALMKLNINPNNKLKNSPVIKEENN